MKQSTTDQVKGNLHELKGKVKETTGHVLNKPKMEADGKMEKVAGKVQQKVAQVEKVFDK